MELFTIGYEKRTIAEYVAILVEHRIDVVVDVRETAWSHKPGFSKAALEQALGEAGVRYVHVPELGNPKWLRGEAEDHAEMVELYRAYLEGHPEVVDGFFAVMREEGGERGRVALTCFEREPGECHRGVLAGMWVGRCGGEVVHLGAEA